MFVEILLVFNFQHSLIIKMQYNHNAVAKIEQIEQNIYMCIDFSNLFSKYFHIYKLYPNLQIQLVMKKHNITEYGSSLKRKREFISLLIMNDTHKKISIIYRRIVKLATSSCEGTSSLRVEQQPKKHFMT